MDNKSLMVMKQQTVDAVLKSVVKYQEKGELTLPPNYSTGNALKSAWLILQDTYTGKNDGKRPVLEACTPISITNALLSMLIQGLQPDKKQCYFVARGKNLTLMRSYFGSIAVAKRVDETIEEIYPEVIYEGDTFVTEKKRGKKYVVEHKQDISRINKGKIIGAYAQVVYKDGTENTEIMTMAEIAQAWMQSDNKPFDDEGNIKTTSVHGKFTAEMCKKTVINRVCKKIINTSDDHSLLYKVIKATEDDSREAKVYADVEEKANAIDVSMDGEIVEQKPLAEESDVIDVEPIEANASEPVYSVCNDGLDDDPEPEVAEDAGTEENFPKEPF